MSKELKKNILEWLLHIIVAIGLGLVIILYVGRLTIVDGNSMAPTLQNQNVIIIESLTQRFDSIKPGDIVVLKIPELLEGDKKYAIKRIIAVENQHVEIRDGKVFVDGTALVENYINGEATIADDAMYADVIVPEDCIYVLGDNRMPEKSRDSRTFGVIKEDRIIGKSWIRLFPFSEAGPVR